MITPAEFILRFPEFAEEDPLRIQRILDEAALIMAESNRWLSFYEVALAHLAAHLVTIYDNTAAGDSSAMGPVKRQEVDDTIVEMAVGNAPYTADMMFSTSYGKMYIMYRRMAFAGIYGV